MINDSQKKEDPLLIILLETIKEQKSISGILKRCPDDAALHRVNAGLSDVASLPGSIYFRRSGYEHLKTAQFDLEKANLTDKQLTAISLVFYCGAKKKRAARAMNITSQALSDHLKAGLKKIQMSLG